MDNVKNLYSGFMNRMQPTSSSGAISGNVGAGGQSPQRQGGMV